MYHAASSGRDADMATEKKRPRKQPPNQVWLDAIMSKTRSNEPSPSAAGAPPPHKQMRMMAAVEGAPAWHARRGPSPTHHPHHHHEYARTAAGADPTSSRSSRSPSPAVAALMSVGQELPPVASPGNDYADQLLADQHALAAAVARSLKDLVADTDCSFVARSVCHLCGNTAPNLVPVVNFCPEFAPTHSLCREHLRSMHRVRLEDIFAGKNQPTVSKRALRCTVCSLSCPCSKCQLQRNAEVARYRKWLAGQTDNGDTGRTAPRRLPSPLEDEPAAMPRARARQSTPPPPPPLPPSVDSVYHDARSDGIPHRRREGRQRKMIGPDMEDLPPPPPPEAQEKRRSSDRPVYYVEDKPVGMAADGSYPYDAAAMAGIPPPSLRADEKPPSRGGRIPKRAAKESVPYPLDTSSADYGSRNSTPRGGLLGGSAEPPDLASPSAASVMNCSDSEKSLVSLLSSLNQRVTPAVRYFAESDEPRFRDMMDSTARPCDEDQLDGRTVSSREYGSTGATMEEAEKAESNQRRLKRKRDANHDNAGVGSSAAVVDVDAEDDSAPASVPNEPVATLANDRGVEGASYRQKAPTSLAAVEKKGKAQSGPSGSVDLPSPSPRSRLSGRAKTAAAPPPPPAEPKGSTRKRDAPSVPPVAPPASSRKRKSDAMVMPTPSDERKGPREVKQRSRGRKAADDQKPRKSEKKRRGRASSLSDEEMKYSPDEDDDDEDAAVEGDGDDESELDTNLDYCEVCLAAGDLVCCDVCPRSFHLKCLKMTEDDLPEGDWQCAECKKQSYFESFGAAVAAKTTVPSKCLQIIQCLKSHPFSKPFLHPVENVPHYTNIVKQPMDLSTIEKKLLENKYMVSGKGTLQGAGGACKILHLGSFAEDVRLVWANCKLFNDDGSGITRAADHLSNGFENLYHHVLQFVERMSTQNSAAQSRWEEKKPVAASEPTSQTRPKEHANVATESKTADEKPTASSSEPKTTNESVAPTKPAATSPSTQEPVFSSSSTEGSAPVEVAKTSATVTASSEPTASQKPTVDANAKAATPSTAAAAAEAELLVSEKGARVASSAEKPASIDTTTDSSAPAGRSVSPSPVTSTTSSTSSPTESSSTTSFAKIAVSTSTASTDEMATSSENSAVVARETSAGSSEAMASTKTVEPAPPASSAAASDPLAAKAQGVI